VNAPFSWVWKLPVKRLSTGRIMKKKKIRKIRIVVKLQKRDFMAGPP
jgi:hypothetical protein